MRRERPFEIRAGATAADEKDRHEDGDTRRHPKRGITKLEDTVAVTPSGCEIFGENGRAWNIGGSRRARLNQRCGRANARGWMQRRVS